MPPTAKLLLLFLALLIAFLLVLPILVHRQQFTFRHRSLGYYADFTRACDSLLAQHPVGTNKFVEVPINDPSLPDIIRQVHPFSIKVASNRVWILAWGPGRGNGVAIIWEPQSQGQTNVWTLRTAVENQTRTLYVAAR